MSFANVRKKFKIYISTGPKDKQPSITVIKSNGSPMFFKEIANGLYVYDASNDIQKKDNSILKPNCEYSLVSTVKQNEQNFTPREIRAAQAAIKLLHKIGRPSYQTYTYMLENNFIRDCPVTVLDAKRAVAIYGKDVGSLKGKTKRLRPKHTTNVNLTPLPDFILKWHINVTLCIDIFYINQMPFFHAIS